MKNIILTLLFFAISVFSFAQNNTDLLGEWCNSKEDIVITIFEVNETISAKITWMKSPNNEDGIPKTDFLNPDESLRDRSRIGTLMMYDLTYIAGNIWDNGSLYIPKTGKIYSGMLRLKNENTLNIRGYVGFSFFERYSSTWTRVLESDKFTNETVREENLLTQLRVDLIDIIKLIENISLKPAEEILQKIEKENLLIKLQSDLSKVIKKIEKIKKTE
tara:strand:- start:145 stop:798 length:654 start_codon:yes stop_codon:yes gene_type:complete